MRHHDSWPPGRDSPIPGFSVRPPTPCGASHRARDELPRSRAVTWGCSSTIEYWVHRFEEEGLSGLVDLERPGRPSRLGDGEYREIGEVLRLSPLEVGMGTNLWDGKTLSEFIQSRYRISLGVRQCQRFFRQLGFRMRKPRPVIARADPERQEEHKKNFEQ